MEETGQGLHREGRVVAPYQPLQMFICLCLISGCGHIADELEISCIYITNFPEIAHYELVARRCF